MYRTQAATALILTCAITASQACSPAFITYSYELDNQQVVYAQDAKYSQSASIINRLIDADSKQFHRVHPLADANSWVDYMSGDNFNDEHNYFTDNRHVFWQGKALSNPPDSPQIDAPSFRQPFNNLTFAVDRYSIYYQGQRTDDNTGYKQVDLKTLQRVDENIMKDARNLYHFGRYIGTANGFDTIVSQSFGGEAFCMPTRTNAIYRNRDQIFVNGQPIEADVGSFAIRRWMPGLLLDYTDSNGAHTYRYGKTEQQLQQALNDHLKYASKGFVALRDKLVYTRIRVRTKDGIDWQTANVPDFNILEPSHTINRRAIQQGQRLYVLNGDIDDDFKPITLTTHQIELDMVIRPPYTLGKTHLYFANDGGVQIFPLHGRFVPMSDYFAHDDRYVYVLSPSYAKKPVKRYETSDPGSVRLRQPNYNYSDLTTAEGYYSHRGEFHPANTKQLRSLSRFYPYATDGKTVYYEDKPLRGVDPATFRMVGDYNFAADARHAFYYGRQIKGIDPASMQVLSNGYSKDRRGVYFTTEPIKGADPKSFQILPDGDRWARDVRNVYYAEHKLPALDIASFRQINHDYAVDNQHVYYQNTLLKQADSKTFQVVDGKIFDKRHQYKDGKIIGSMQKLMPIDSY